MKKNKLFLRGMVLCLMMFFMVSSVMAQDNVASMAYLKQTFPQLTALYEQELKDCHTHYIFAVDVSGTMSKYDTTVTPALIAFAQALPFGELVDIIPYGTEAKDGRSELSRPLEGPSQKQALTNALAKLYTNPDYVKDLHDNTDIAKMIKAVNRQIEQNREYQMNVVVLIGDYLNDLPNGGEQLLKEDMLKQLNKDYDNFTNDCYIKTVALKLPKAGSGKGYCLDQLRDKVFCNTTTTRRFEIQDIIDDKVAIAHWFEQMTREIMIEKLKAVIQLDNKKSLNPILKTSLNIDGKTTAELHWTPNKLYKQVEIGATTTDNGSNYVFHNEKTIKGRAMRGSNDEKVKFVKQENNGVKTWGTTTDTALYELNLGQLKHKRFGLRRYNEKLNIGINLPTPYDEELQKLSIDKPIANTAEDQKGLLFTFFLPFWLTATIVILLIIYILLVFKAIARNAKERFIGNVTIKDSKNRVVNGPVFVKLAAGKTLRIGKNGSNGCLVSGANWTLQLKKVKSNPLLFWGRPSFEWKVSGGDGFVCDARNRKQGRIGRYGKNNAKGACSIKCGPSANNFTNVVDINIKK